MESGVYGLGDGKYHGWLLKWLYHIKFFAPFFYLYHFACVCVLCGLFGYVFVRWWQAIEEGGVCVCFVRLFFRGFGFWVLGG